MPSRGTLVLLIFAAVSSVAFERLKILLIRPDSDLFFPDKIQKALLEGASKIQQSVNVAQLVDHVIRAEDVLKCLQLEGNIQHMGTAGLIDGSNSNNKVSLNQDITLNHANFAVVMEISKERCEKDTELMASAQPCYVRDGNRPPIARIRVCPQLDRWTDFLESNTASDVFRHELLHALGWGTVVSTMDSNLTQRDISLNWNIGATSKPVVRKFLDFGQSATEFARIYFNCSQLEGLESDRADKMHLSEYIFGNELMTPIISTATNYFTEFSARILEATHLGPDRWYTVNRLVIAPEVAAYSYGKGWGCEFVATSCYDYIQLRMSQRRSTFPFCSAADYRRRDHSLHICSSTYQRALRCDSIPLDSEDKSGNGLTPIPMSHIFPGIPPKFAHRVPSSPETRFCPFIEALSRDGVFQSPPIDEIISC